MVRLSTFIALLIVFFVSCKKEKNSIDSGISKDNILSRNAHIVDTSALTSTSISHISLIKSKMNFIPTVGDIILSSPSVNNPRGAFCKIVSIEDKGEHFYCQTEISSLNEAFEQLYIDYSFEGSYSHEATLKTTGNASLNIPFSGYPLANGVEASGNIRLNIPAVKIKYEKSKGSILPDTVIIRSNINTNGSRVEVKANQSVTLTEKTLYTFNNLPVIEVPVVVAGIPLIIPFYQYIEINTLPVNINGKMKVTLRPEISATLGISYMGGEWKNLSTYSIGASTNKPIKEDFDATVSASLTFFNPAYKIGPFWDPTLYAFFKIPNTIQATIKTSTPNYSIKYNLGVDVGIHYQFWTGLKGEKTLQIPLHETTLAEGNWNEYKIGDIAFGGIIFYLDSTKQHGMVCATEDQSTFIYPGPGSAPWDTSHFNSNADYNPPNINTDTIFGSGSENTDKIINIIGTGYYAAYICRNYNGGGYNDWFLPSYEELKKLYDNKDIIKGFGDWGHEFDPNIDDPSRYVAYWSSSQADYQFAYLVTCPNNCIPFQRKDFNIARTRAVRKF